MAVDVVILLGGNIGDVGCRLSMCRELLAQRVGAVVSMSSELETLPWGFSSDDLFVNQALVVRTTLTPSELLEQTQAIEQLVGRDRAEEMEQKVQSGERYASRVIDVDIITYGQEVVECEGLEIPHPRMHLREFVLRPMAEVAPKWRHPILNITTEELLNKVSFG
ncbi:MAG: 2-amino-4-hydroxy-6-hydroxymethyldihydropteridine diphosphokinase [Rikenellaceae bacterium]